MGEKLACGAMCIPSGRRGPRPPWRQWGAEGVKASRSGWCHLCGRPVWLVDESALTFFPPTPAPLREGVGWPRPLPHHLDMTLDVFRSSFFFFFSLNLSGDKAAAVE